MTKNEMSINFSGLTHDHSVWSAGVPNYHHHDDLQQQQDGSKHSDDQQDSSTCSTIAILRRHPMYDCLVLVKKYRECLDGYSLEFPTNRINDEQQEMNNENDESAKANNNDDNDEVDENSQRSQQQQTRSGLVRNCSRRKLVSRFLDGDDPIYQSGCAAHNNNNTTDPSTLSSSSSQTAISHGVVHPISTQLDDDLAQSSGELVHVPVNGLLDRLKSYTEQGLAVDSRVYAFAMGLKTAERILTTGSMREIHETPI